MTEDIRGLEKKSIEILREFHGPNEIVQEKTKSRLKEFIEQFKSPLIYVLFIVAAITLVLEEYSDTIFILLVTVFNAIIGFIQERRAENTISALKNLIKPKAKVYRDGELKQISASDIVPGDIVLIEAGDIVPADGVILYSKNLQVIESQLTGESLPVSKTQTAGLASEIQSVYKEDIEFESIQNLIRNIRDTVKSTEESNLLFQSTTVSTGRALMFVYKTGMQTEVGQISDIVLSQVDNPPPLSKKINKLTRAIIGIVLLSAISVIFIGLAKQLGFEEIFLISVSLGVSSIPEGLPIVLTLTLAIGAWRMGRANAIVRSLPSVSTLAGVDIICTDKTGTLTDGILTLKEIVPGNVSSDSNEEKTTMEYIREAITLCNGAELDKNNEGIGDTLDVAILKDNYKYGINHEDVRDAYKEVDNIPFDSEYKYMATLNELDGGRKMIVKGAPDVLIERCSLNKNDFDSLTLEIEKHNSNGLRTILVCEKQTDSDSIGHEDINELTYLALLVFEDKLRPNVKESVEISRRAGIRVLMITGDHLMTAKYIGKASGIYNEKTDIALSQDDIENMSNSELRETLPNVSVIARAKPEVKMRVINIFKEQNMVVAMTGDGVNDAPALTAADIGISMGKIGTDVARESSDMVLTDDHFETIVQGIEEARVVFENLRKVIAYLFSTSIGEVIIIIAAISLGYQVPLIAVQILWLNLVTDGFLDVAIATESKENEIMNYSPKRYFGRILSIPHYARIIFLGVIMALGSILVFIFLRENYEIGVARTGTLIAMAAFQWFNAFNVRSEDKSIFKIGVFKNKFLLLAISIVVILQIAAVHLPLMQGLLQTESVDLYIWIGGIIIASSIVFIEEGRKGLFDMLNSKIRFNSINRD